MFLGDHENLAVVGVVRPFRLILTGGAFLTLSCLLLLGGSRLMPCLAIVGSHVQQRLARLTGNWSVKQRQVLLGVIVSAHAHKYCRLRGLCHKLVAGPASAWWESRCTHKDVLIKRVGAGGVGCERGLGGRIEKGIVGHPGTTAIVVGLWRRRGDGASEGVVGCKVHTSGGRRWRARSCSEEYDVRLVVGQVGTGADDGGGLADVKRG